ncbi:MAG: SET domain-containing protein [Phycisphaeraceae bacterium]
MFEVKESPLHGRGLFATSHIPADTVISWLRTEPAQEHELDGPYVLWVGGEEPVRVTCDMRFINHGDEPNTAYFDDLSVMALRDIEPGEELLHNYMGDAADHEGVEVDFAQEHEIIDDIAPPMVPA